MSRSAAHHALLALMLTFSWGCGGEDVEESPVDASTSEGAEAQPEGSRATPDDAGGVDSDAAAVDDASPPMDTTPEQEVAFDDVDTQGEVTLPEPDISEPSEPQEPGPESVDCANLPAGPFELIKLEGPLASEDLAFDREGHLIGSNDNAIFKSLYGGQPQVFVPNMNFRAGLRYLPSGQLIVCNNHTGELVRVDPDGTQHVLLSGLSYPNGVTVDLKGWVYFSEHDNNQVRRVHPYTGEYTILTNEVQSPNGLTFSPDYATLYIGGFNGSGVVYAMSISPEGVPGKLVAWAEDVGTGWLDGMATDACGNIYIADYGATVIYRISPDGQQKDKIISGAGFSNAYLPNMQWGSGVGGWDPLTLYLPDGWNKGVFEVSIGVPSAPVPYP